MNTNTTNIAWTIAGSDSGGGAGIQADLLTFNQLGVHGCTVITALTAQNTQTVLATQPTSPDQLNAQLQALNDDLPPHAIKLGMLGELATLKPLIPWLQRYQGRVPIVCDPVMVSTSGASLLATSALDAFKYEVLPYTDLLTPNLVEAQALLNTTITSPTAMEEAAQLISQRFNVNTVLIKGGHAPNQVSQHQCCDFFYSATTSSPYGFWLTGPYYAHTNTHGSGCSLSAAITAALAQGYSLKDAVTLGKLYINQSIRQALPLGKGAGPVAHPRQLPCLDDMPCIKPALTRGLSHQTHSLTAQPIETRLPFPRCSYPIGLYPLITCAAELAELIPLGITTAQLRIKNQPEHRLENEIKACIKLAKRHHLRLFINDHWALAIKHNAYGAHLGQDDVDTADISAIQHAGLHLGISTHSPYEIARAHTFKPSYIAFGPIYPTRSKVVAALPQGVKRLRYWTKVLSPYPIVAIGGITSDNLSDITSAQPSGIATLVKSINDTKQLITQYQAGGRTTCRTKENTFHTRYSRQIQLPAIGEQGQRLLKQTRVLCVGAGGLGSASLIYLASAGVGTLGIIDDDIVALSNLQRQILYREKDIGQRKVTLAQRRLQAINPDCHLLIYPTRLDADNAQAIIKNYDIVIDGSDNFRTRYIVNDVCFAQNKPYISASVTAFEGQCGVFIAGTPPTACLELESRPKPSAAPCYRCAFPLPTTSSNARLQAAATPNCQNTGVLATLPGLLGTLQATEAIKCAIGLGQPLLGRLLRIDATTMQFDTFTLTKDPNCTTCGNITTTIRRKTMMKTTTSTPTITPHALRNQLKENPALTLIDVRQPNEHAAYNIGGQCIPLNTLEQNLAAIDPKKLVVVYCQAGIRSASAAAYLLKKGFEQTVSLEGGVNAWLSH